MARAICPRARRFRAGGAGAPPSLLAGRFAPLCPEMRGRPPCGLELPPHRAGAALLSLFPSAPPVLLLVLHAGRLTDSDLLIYLMAICCSDAGRIWPGSSVSAGGAVQVICADSPSLPPSSPLFPSLFPSPSSHSLRAVRESRAYVVIHGALQYRRFASHLKAHF